MPKVCYSLLVSPCLIIMTNVAHLVIFSVCKSTKFVGAVTVYILLAAILVEIYHIHLLEIIRAFFLKKNILIDSKNLIINVENSDLCIQ